MHRSLPERGGSGITAAKNKKNRRPEDDILPHRRQKRGIFVSGAKVTGRYE
jgi:hypothetical protein